MLLSETDKADLLRAFEQLLTRTLEMPRTDGHRGPWSESLPVPDADDVLGLLRSGSESARFHRSKSRASSSAEPGDAIRDEDEQQPGKDKIIFRTKDGVETCYRNLPAVERRPALLENSELDDAPGGIDTENRPLSDDDQWNVLLDEKASASERVTA